MADDGAQDMEVHPLVKAQEAKGEPTIEFRGFAGTGDDQTLRLYMDLSMSTYVDIPREGVAFVEKDPSGETGRVRAFVHAEQKVREVNRRTVAARESALSLTAFPTTDRYPRPELGGLIGCYRRCEQVFADRAGEILRLRNRAQLVCDQFGLNSPQCINASNMAASAEAEAVGRLFQCIEQCQRDAPYLLRFSPSPGEIASNIARKYLG